VHFVATGCGEEDGMKVEEIAVATSGLDAAAFATSYPHRALVLSASPLPTEPTSDSEVLFLVKSERNPLRGMIAIGRAAENDVVIDHVMVSKRHATLSIEAAGWKIMDLGATNGTFVDGTRLTPFVAYPIKSGARISFGECHARYLDEVGMFEVVHRVHVAV
jgi:hypothetical protein